MALQESSDQGSEQVRFLIEGEVAGVEEVGLGIGDLTAEREGAGNREERIVFTP